jgi:Zn-dependent M32 family carboxypeptidase
MNEIYPDTPRHKDKVLRAVTENNLDYVKREVKNGFDIRQENDYLLRAASIFGRYYMVKYLLENGADINNLINHKDLKYVQDIEILGLITKHIRKQKLQRLENG